MSEQVATMASSMPAWAFLVPFAAGVLAFFGRWLGARLTQFLAVAAPLIVTLLGLEMARRVVDGAVLTGWGNELRVDGLSVLLVLTIGIVGTLTALYSVRYVKQPGLLTRVGAAASGVANRSATRSKNCASVVAVSISRSASVSNAST